MSIQSSITLALVVATTVMAGQTRSVGAPEVFNVNAQVKGAAGAAAATLQVHIDRYTPDADRTAVEDALKHGGYANFLNALRKAPEVGRVQSGERQFTIRWARQTNTKDGGRTIVVVTDKPIFFIGGAAADAKPRAGYDVGTDSDDGGRCRLRQRDDGRGGADQAGGRGRVQVDDYADEPIKLVTVSRLMK